MMSPEVKKILEDLSEQNGDDPIDDDSYEFDEVCANCGALVAASN